MRIIAGSLSGRIFDAPPGHRTHPMSERIRGALFNALGDISGLTVLDAYAGSGALAFEAVSRGAESALCLDVDKSAAQTISSNIHKLGLIDKISVTKAAATAWSKRHPTQQFDIVLLDPPYSQVEPKDLLQLSGHAKTGGIIVLSLPPDNGFAYAPSRQELISSKNYGDASLYFYRQLI